MHLLTHTQPLSQLQIEYQTLEDFMPKPQSIGDFGYAVVVSMACLGATLHGVAMALRKHFGIDHEGFEFWSDWRWWTGAVLDGVAGCLIWPAMPFVPVELFAPLIIVVQLGSSCAIGMAYFKENSSVYHAVGLACAMAGVVGISLSEPHHAVAFDVEEFWSAWVSPRVLIVHCITATLLLGSYVFAQPATFWALAASAFEGWQYICSRTIVDSMVALKWRFMLAWLQPTIFAAGCMKVCFGLTGLHLQQSGLKSDLSSFAGIFLVSCTLFMCIYGTAFFGDELHASGVFLASSFVTLAGIWLLNQNEASKDSDEDSKARDVEGKDDDCDSVYEGAEKTV